MPNPIQPTPENKPSSAAAGQSPATEAAEDTKRPGDSVPVAKATSTKLPTNFGRYQVEKLLGKGAMGAVYLARDTQLGRHVALKISKFSGSGAAKLLQRLKTEAQAAAQIDHPSVCPVYDSGDIDGTAYIAMQYIEGESFRDHIQNQARTPAEVVNLILHLAEGLAEAHSKNIYHRDLKPENIKLNRRGIPVIMDFGLAKLAATVSSDAGKTQSGTILGSPAYMSPEQAGGKVDEIDHRSDLYSLGIMLFEMLTGQWPFTGATLQVMGQKSILDPPSPLTIKPDLNPDLADVCHKLIAKKREDRYQTAVEAIAALKAINLGSGPPGAGGSISTEQSPSPIASSLPASEHEDAFSTMIARKRQEAKRESAAAKFAGKTRQIKQSVVVWWRRKPRGVKWIGLAALLLIAGMTGFWAGRLLSFKHEAGPRVRGDDKANSIADDGTEDVDEMLDDDLSTDAAVEEQIVKSVIPDKGPPNRDERGNRYSTPAADAGAISGKQMAKNDREVPDDRSASPPVAENAVASEMKKTESPPATADAAERGGFPDAVQQAEKTLIKGFEREINELDKASRTDASAIMQREKEAFQNTGAVPWSSRMRKYTEQFIKDLRLAGVRRLIACGEFEDDRAIRKTNVFARNATVKITVRLYSDGTYVKTPGDPNETSSRWSAAFTKSPLDVTFSKTVGKKTATEHWTFDTDGQEFDVSTVYGKSKKLKGKILPLAE